AGAFPDRVEWSLAIETRKDRLFDVAVSTMTLERLRNHRDRALASPELRDRHADALEARFSRIGRAVERSGEAHHQDGRRLGLDRKVGEHIDHQRLVAEQLAERAAVRGVMRGLRDGLAHQRCGTYHAVK